MNLHDVCKYLHMQTNNCSLLETNISDSGNYWNDILYYKYYRLITEELHGITSKIYQHNYVPQSIMLAPTIARNICPVFSDV